MCGICGVVWKNRNVDESDLRVMTRQLRHRGPDDEGFHIDGKIGLGHTRLSIIDLSGGRQPIYNENKRICIVFNGEVYNYKELKMILIKKGHEFSTQSDTEVILHLYEEADLDCPNLLRGMFAFAIWDSEKRRLFIVRDRIGKKPLYYAEVAEGFLFASEMKSLLVHPVLNRQINYEALRDFLAYGYVPSPKTILKGVSKLEPGHSLIWKDGNVIKNRFWELKYEPKLNIEEEEAVECIRDHIADAVKIRLESDVPLGVLLSGGIDSGAVVAYVRRFITGDLHTFTIGFEDEKYNEIPMARSVAKTFNTKHEEFVVKPDAVGILPQLVWYFDEPFGDSSAIPTYYVAKMARQKVTVVLNGDGGDESFFGYPRYLSFTENDLMSLWRKAPFVFREKFFQPFSAAFFNFLPKSALFQRLYFGNSFSLLDPESAYLEGMRLLKDEIIDLIAGEAIPKDQWKSNPASLLMNIMRSSQSLCYEDKLIRTDVNSYLPEDLLVKMDRMSMANSLEARSPFLDHRLMEYAARLPVSLKFKNNTLKYLLKKSLKGLIPDNILEGKKHGFSVPVGLWFRKDLRRFSEDILLSSRATQRGLFKKEWVERILKYHQSGRKQEPLLIWSLLNIEMWCRTFLDRTDISSGPISL